MAIIKDGTGSGNAAKITGENRLETDTVSRSLPQHINEVFKKHFSITFEAIDPVGADDYFLYFKNTGTKNIHLTKFRFKSTVVGTVELHAVSGTAAFTSETVIAPANRFLGASEGLTVVTSADTDITGLTNDATLLRLTLSTADTDFVDEAPSHIIIPPGQAMAGLWDTATGILAGTVDVYEDQGFGE